jgi:hypothetical protein
MGQADGNIVEVRSPKALDKNDPLYLPNVIFNVPIVLLAIQIVIVFLQVLCFRNIQAMLSLQKFWALETVILAPISIIFSLAHVFPELCTKLFLNPSTLPTQLGFDGCIGIGKCTF